MLKCPACQKRVLGQDLVTGVCSHCGKNLAGSGSASLPEKQKDGPTSDTIDPVTIKSSQVDDSGDIASDQTFISDEVPEHVQRELADKTIAIEGEAVVQPDLDRTIQSDDFSDSASGSRSSSESEQTFISDDFTSSNEVADPGPDSKTQRDTHLNEDSLHFDEESSAHTVVADENVGSGSKTRLDPIDKTVVVDDESEALLKTVESVWGGEGQHPNAPPSMTIKSVEVRPAGAASQSLVIKTRMLVESKSLPSVPDGEGPEYELIKILGEGGMGVVYDARQTSIDRNVALKMIKGDAAGSDKRNAKFLAEAVVTGDLDHPNIVPIYDVGANSQGQLFYSMKKVQGTPWLNVLTKKSLAENIDILMRTADAIAFAHARSVVHRDLKPENIMLGEFGEVLVMDWGLAHPIKGFRKPNSVGSLNTMGGTPAYMAPEMATGPIEKITTASDIYLLGAILYEIITGHAPHIGKTAMKCLMAAARNDITPTDKKGELVDIARKAMSTDPNDRYPTVKDFQAAIRDYQSHLESIQLSTRAEDDLKGAGESEDYQQYQRALFGFQEAYELWSGNHRAAMGVSNARLAYAGSAKRKGDFDLGLSLLEESNPDHETLRRELIAARDDRVARQKRLVFLKRAAIGLVASVLVIVTGSAIWIRNEQQKAVASAIEAMKQKNNALVAEKEARVAEQEALHQKSNAEIAKDEAVKAQRVAETEREKAEDARRLAETAKQKEEYEAYISKIGLAASQIDKNAFDAASKVLDSCSPRLRNWEWGRLTHLCSQSDRKFVATMPLIALAIDRDGKRFATGGWDATAIVWDREAKKILKEIKQGGDYVNSVAFSPDGKYLATGGNDPAGFIQIWDLDTGKNVSAIKGHEDEVLSVAFSKDGSRLLTSSYDKTARLWEVSGGRVTSQIRDFKGHTRWVWSAQFSTDEHRVVTASHDGTVIVWDVESKSEQKPLRPFTGHKVPVFSAAFSPDGKHVVSAGNDGRVLTWNPDDVKEFNYDDITKEVIPPTASYRTFEGHTDAVRSVSFSSDGKLLLSAGFDNTVRVWDFGANQLLTTIRGHGGRVNAAAFLADATRILSASQDEKVMEWSIAGYEEIRTLQGRTQAGHKDDVLAAAYSPDQRRIVTASRDRTARIWDSRTAVPELTLTAEPERTLSEGHDYLASTAQFYPGGRRLLTSAVDNTVRIWDAGTGSEQLRLNDTGRSAAAMLSHNGKWIATGCDEKLSGGEKGSAERDKTSVKLWDAGTGQLLRKLEAHKSEVTSVAFSPDDRMLVTGDAIGHVKLWNIDSGRVVARLDGHTRRIAAIVFVPDGSRVLTASGDNTVGQWDVTTGQELPKLILKHPDSILAMQSIPGGNLIVTSCKDRQLRVWNADEARVVQTIGPFQSDIRSVSVSSDGRRLLIASSEERTVRLWDLETKREIQVLSPEGHLGPLVNLKQSGGLLWSTTFQPETSDVLTMAGSDVRLWDAKTGRERMSFSPHGPVASAHFSPDGDLIVTGSKDNSAKIWDAKTGHVVRKLEGEHTGFVNTAIFSPDGKSVLTASDDKTAKLWDVKTGAVIKTLDGHQDHVRSAVFSSNGQFIVTTSSDKLARLWKVETGKVVREFKGHKWAVICADISSDGKMLVTGSEDQTAIIWDVNTGKRLYEQPLSGHTASVTSVSFSPDGSRVITGSNDQTAKLWDSRTGKQILTLSGHKKEVTSVTFSPFGNQILTGSRDGTAVIWLSQDWTKRDGQNETVARSIPIIRRPRD